MYRTSDPASSPTASANFITVALPWFERWHYEAIRGLLARPEELPATFLLWDIEARRRLKQLADNSIAAIAVAITPDELRDYCGARGIVPSLAVCDTLANLKASDNAQTASRFR